MASKKSSPAKLIVKILFGVILVVAVGALVYTAIQSQQGKTGATPREVFENYTNFVRPYLPPSGVRPGATNVSQWQEYLDSDMRDWFDENADTLAFLGMRDPEEWKAAGNPDRRSEALKYLFSQNPWKGGIRRGEDVQEEQGRAEIRYSFTGSAETRMILRNEGGTWRIDDIVGARETLDQRLAGITLPE